MKPVKDVKAAERNRRFREIQAKEGFVLVQVKVPASRRDDILEAARQMRTDER